MDCIGLTLISDVLVFCGGERVQSKKSRKGSYPGTGGEGWGSDWDRIYAIWCWPFN